MNEFYSQRWKKNTGLAGKFCFETRNHIILGIATMNVSVYTISFSSLLVWVTDFP